MQGIISYNGYDIIVENIDNNDVYYYSKDNKTFVGSKMSLNDFIYKIENVYFKKTNFEKIKEMSKEEMKKYIVTYLSCENCPCSDICSKEICCEDAVERWLSE